jgi:hypothetical protein
MMYTHAESYSPKGMDVCQKGSISPISSNSLHSIHDAGRDSTYCSSSNEIGPNISESHCRICGKICNVGKELGHLNEVVMVENPYQTRVRLSPYSCKDLTFANASNGWKVVGINVECLYCYQSFSKVHTLRKHFLGKHQLTSISLQILKARHRYFCELCTFFYEESKFLKHYESHKQKESSIEVVSLGNSISC